MRRAADGPPGAGRPYQLTVLSGHDTVIGPVLAALGVYASYCLWPPYASRIVFELWKARNISNSSSSSSSRNVGRKKNESPSRFVERVEEEGKKEDVYVRVLFNGEDLVAKMEPCVRWMAAKTQPQGTDIVVIRSPPPLLCPLHILEEIVEGLLDGHASLAEACAAGEQE